MNQAYLRYINHHLLVNNVIRLNFKLVNSMLLTLTMMLLRE